MIIFHNPGLLPLDAIRLMGASVKAAGSFGRFGTGFKYGLATILRGGGLVRIWLGQQELGFTTRKVELKGEVFEEVMMSTGSAMLEALGFTTALGKDWEPWMALREFACNARDEGGDFTVIEATSVPPCFSARDDETVIVVDWPALDEAAKDGEAAVFVPDVAALAEERGVRILPGPSQYLYHRGVRVWKLPKRSVFTYDITSRVELTEDRSVKYGFCVVADVRNALLALDDEDIIRGAVTAKKGQTWEAGFDWSGTEWAPTAPGQTWLEVVAEVRLKDFNVSDSAKNVLLKHQAFHQSQHATWYDTEGLNDNLSEAAAILEDEAGFELKDVNVFITADLPAGALSAVNKGSVFVTHRLLEAPVIVIVRELIRRLCELEGGGDHDQLLDAITTRLFNIVKGSRYGLQREFRMFEEDARAGSFADYLLLAMDMRGEEYPARPSELTAEARAREEAELAAYEVPELDTQVQPAREPHGLGGDDDIPF